MESNLMWSYLIHLSNHMWDDPSTPARGLYREPNWKDAIETDLSVWDEVVQKLGECKYNALVIDLGDGVQYESHPEICAPDAWSKEFLKQKLDELRALGIQPIPKLNFSASHDIWLKEYHRMVSTPIYYQVCADLIAEVCELFDHPAYFHLGWDEEIYQHQCKYEIAIIRSDELWLHDLHFLMAECAKHGARPWIWGGIYQYHKDVIDNKLSRDVLITVGFSRAYVNPGEERPWGPYGPDLMHSYSKLGFDQVVFSSTWAWNKNALQAVGFGQDQIPKEQLKGFLMGTWLHTKDEERYGLLNGAYKLYHARKKWYPETL